MDISYIVSTYNRPMALQLVILSLLLQSHQSFEIIVTDNSNKAMGVINQMVVGGFKDSRIRYMRTKAPTCYHSAEIGAKAAVGDYLCFPNDDSYYVPLFGELMLQSCAALVACNILYDPRLRGHYEVLNTQTVNGEIDKTSFIVRHELFHGFPSKPEQGVPANCDGLLIEQLIRDGASYHKVKDVLVVHN